MCVALSPRTAAWAHLTTMLVSVGLEVDLASTFVGSPLTLLEQVPSGSGAQLLFHSNDAISTQFLNLTGNGLGGVQWLFFSATGCGSSSSAVAWRELTIPSMNTKIAVSLANLSFTESLAVCLTDSFVGGQVFDAGVSLLPVAINSFSLQGRPAHVLVGSTPDVQVIGLGLSQQLQLRLSASSCAGPLGVSPELWQVPHPLQAGPTFTYPLYPEQTAQWMPTMQVCMSIDADASQWFPSGHTLTMVYELVSVEYAGVQYTLGGPQQISLPPSDQTTDLVLSGTGFAQGNRLIITAASCAAFLDSQHDMLDLDHSGMAATAQLSADIVSRIGADIYRLCFLPNIAYPEHVQDLNLTMAVPEFTSLSVITSQGLSPPRVAYGKAAKIVVSGRNIPHSGLQVGLAPVSVGCTSTEAPEFVETSVDTGGSAAEAVVPAALMSTYVDLVVCVRLQDTGVIQDTGLVLEVYLEGFQAAVMQHVVGVGGSIRLLAGTTTSIEFVNQPSITWGCASLRPSCGQASSDGQSIPITPTVSLSSGFPILQLEDPHVVGPFQGKLCLTPAESCAQDIHHFPLDTGITVIIFTVDSTQAELPYGSSDPDDFVLPISGSYLAADMRFVLSRQAVGCTALSASTTGLAYLPDLGTAGALNASGAISLPRSVAQQLANTYSLCVSGFAAPPASFHPTGITVTVVIRVDYISIGGSSSWPGSSDDILLYHRDTESMITLVGLGIPDGALVGLAEDCAEVIPESPSGGPGWSTLRAQYRGSVATASVPDLFPVQSRKPQRLCIYQQSGPEQPPLRRDVGVYVRVVEIRSAGIQNTMHRSPPDLRLRLVANLDATVVLYGFNLDDSIHIGLHAVCGQEDDLGAGGAVGISGWQSLQNSVFDSSIGMMRADVLFDADQLMHDLESVPLRVCLRLGSNTTLQSMDSLIPAAVLSPLSAVQVGGWELPGGPSDVLRLFQGSPVSVLFHSPFCFPRAALVRPNVICQGTLDAGDFASVGGAFDACDPASASTSGLIQWNLNITANQDAAGLCFGTMEERLSPDLANTWVSSHLELSLVTVDPIESLDDAGERTPLLYDHTISAGQTLTLFVTGEGLVNSEMAIGLGHPCTSADTVYPEGGVVLSSDSSDPSATYVVEINTRDLPQWGTYDICLALYAGRDHLPSGYVSLGQTVEVKPGIQSIHVEGSRPKGQGEVLHLYKNSPAEVVVSGLGLNTQRMVLLERCTDDTGDLGGWKTPVEMQQKDGKFSVFFNAVHVQDTGGPWSLCASPFPTGRDFSVDTQMQIQVVEIISVKALLATSRASIRNNLTLAQSIEYEVIVTKHLPDMYLGDLSVDEGLPVTVDSSCGLLDRSTQWFGFVSVSESTGSLSFVLPGEVTSVLHTNSMICVHPDPFPLAQDELLPELITYPITLASVSTSVPTLTWAEPAYLFVGGSFDVSLGGTWLSPFDMAVLNEGSAECPTTDPYDLCPAMSTECNISPVSSIKATLDPTVAGALHVCLYSLLSGTWTRFIILTAPILECDEREVCSNHGQCPSALLPGQSKVSYAQSAPSNQTLTPQNPFNPPVLPPPQAVPQMQNPPAAPPAAPVAAPAASPLVASPTASPASAYAPVLLPPAPSAPTTPISPPAPYAPSCTCDDPWTLTDCSLHAGTFRMHPSNYILFANQSLTIELNDQNASNDKEFEWEWYPHPLTHDRDKLTFSVVYRHTPPNPSAHSSPTLLMVQSTQYPGVSVPVLPPGTVEIIVRIVLHQAHSDPDEWSFSETIAVGSPDSLEPVHDTILEAQALTAADPLTSLVMLHSCTVCLQSFTTEVMQLHLELAETLLSLTFDISSLDSELLALLATVLDLTLSDPNIPLQLQQVYDSIP